ncbi:MAG: hypothetical protein VKL59_19480 [Nostocaceae cyanobacterium]|nr:hypothetical protein [Nostocaceae cyanobacterium]
MPEQVQRFPFSSVIAPALFLSSVIFTTLTLPVALLRNEPLTIDLPFFRAEIQPVFEGNNNEQAIRYIGSVVVISTAVGLFKVDASRRLYLARQAQAEKDLKEAEAENMPQQPLEEVESEMTVPPKGLEEELSTSANFDFEALVQAFETIPDSGLSLPTEAPESQNLELSPVADTVDLAAIELGDFFPEYQILDGDELAKKILDPSQYTQCRVKIPRFQQRLLAVAVNGEYYTFLRAEKTIDKVLETIAKLEQKANQIVITKTEKNYAIWLLEPEAYQE